ncbi:hypothetical protein CEXT_364401 [Caerostris extrusa]|uniref:LAGLIDADG homing endonuclease n=1 Tax=Caerostris extrusa TaxID=172846 RepID=A0AAV4M5B5_CAEEX|nr:hypothetical protein CEXT_364401 [Caerostris extrusa]
MASHPWLSTLIAANLSNLTLEERGNGVLAKTSGGDFRYRFRNPDHSSIFSLRTHCYKRGLEPCFGIVCTYGRILTYCKNSSQFLKDWPHILDKLRLGTWSRVTSALALATIDFGFKFQHCH